MIEVTLKPYDDGTRVRVYRDNTKVDEYFVHAPDDPRAGLPAGARVIVLGRSS